MTQGKFEILGEIDDGQEQAELASALGRAREDLDESLPIQIITTGLSCLAVPIRSLVRSLSLPSQLQFVGRDLHADWSHRMSCVLTGDHRDWRYASSCAILCAG